MVNQKKCTTACTYACSWYSNTYSISRNSIVCTLLNCFTFFVLAFFSFSLSLKTYYILLQLIYFKLIALRSYSFIVNCRCVRTYRSSVAPCEMWMTNVYSNIYEHIGYHTPHHFIVGHIKCVQKDKWKNPCFRDMIWIQLFCYVYLWISFLYHCSGY